MESTVKDDVATPDEHSEVISSDAHEEACVVVVLTDNPDSAQKAVEYSMAEPTPPLDASVTTNPGPGDALREMSGDETKSPLNSMPQDIAAILEFAEVPVPAPVAAARARLATANHPQESTHRGPNDTSNVTQDVDSDSNSDSDSDTSSTSSASTSSSRHRRTGPIPVDAGDAGDSDSDGETGNKKPVGPLKTANEIVPDVQLPSITRIDDGERIEHVGEVMSIIDSVVVVKGILGTLGEKVLDTGSLLVWDDRTVIGEVFETFGPTHLPLYSLRFPSSAHIPKDIFQLARKVYHVPSRSNYVFPGALAASQKKGSDASNVYDEEVGDSDADFSDDEKEREWKTRYGKGKARRGDFAVPHPPRPRIRPTDDGDYPFDSSFYDEHPAPPRSPTASSSTLRYQPPTPRSAPMPYDDDVISNIDVESIVGDEHDDNMSVTSSSVHENWRGYRGRGRGRGRGGRGRGMDFGRGRGRGRGRGGHGHTPQPSSYSTPNSNFSFNPSFTQPQFTPRSSTGGEYDPHDPHVALPSNPPPQQPFQPQYMPPNTQFPIPFSPNFMMGVPGMPTQGHINPQFFATAMAMGMHLGMQQNAAMMGGMMGEPWGGQNVPGSDEANRDGATHPTSDSSSSFGQTDGRQGGQ